ncbi:MAG: pseudouridine synthase [Bacilli bacterium]
MNKFIVDSDSQLYNYLRINMTNKSKNNIKSLLKNKCIFVNNKIVSRYDYKLKSGDVIEINKNIKINNFNLEIIYEDNNIIVVNKPSGILTISNKNEKENTLYRQVSDYLKKKKEKVFIIHRLDFDTSGVIMFAKNQKVQKLYQDNWNNLAKMREYTAVVEGITEKKGHIESYLKQTKTLLVYSSKNKDGYFAITDYVRVKHNDKYSLLKIYISTGRRNQIRCHMHDINHPIVGDSRYKSKTNPIKRLALHASTLKIINPLTNELMIFTSDVPKEFNEIIK